MSPVGSARHCRELGGLRSCLLLKLLWKVSVWEQRALATLQCHCLKAQNFLVLSHAPTLWDGFAVWWISHHKYFSPFAISLETLFYALFSAWIPVPPHPNSHFIQLLVSSPEKLFPCLFRDPDCYSTVLSHIYMYIHIHIMDYIFCIFRRNNTLLCFGLDGLTQWPGHCWAQSGLVWLWERKRCCMDSRSSAFGVPWLRPCFGGPALPTCECWNALFRLAFGALIYRLLCSVQIWGCSWRAT